MFKFNKNKIKLSLIEDYIEIIKIENFFSNSFVDIEFDKSIFNKCHSLNCQLSKIYNSIFENLKMNDLSLLILKKELKNNNIIFNNLKLNNFKNINQTLLLLHTDLNQTFQDLLTKLEKLKAKTILHQLQFCL
ncbi:MAG: hypothetical protein J6Q13_04060 [Clostridia bacterium]|nr:hypothetical protein [Clostridia bacterium]